MAARTLLLLCAACFFLTMTLTTAHATGAGLGRRQNNNPIIRAAAAGDVLVNQTCTNATRDFGDKVLLSPEDCASELRSDKRSAGAKDVRDLTLLAIDLVRLSAAAADAKIAGALKANNGSSAAAAADKTAAATTERNLRLCRMDYDMMARLVPECRAAVVAPAAAKIPAGGGGSDDDDDDSSGSDAWGCLDRLFGATFDCEGSVMSVPHAVAAPLWNDVDEAVLRAKLAQAVLAVMLGRYPSTSN